MMKRKNAYSLSWNWSRFFQRLPSEVSEPLDPVILGVTVALALCGLVMVFSASGVLAEDRFSESTYYLQRQGSWLLLGCIVLWVASRLEYAMWRSLMPWLLGLSFVLLVLVLIIGSEINGARRWLNLGWFSLQPAELTKLAVVLYLAAYLGKAELNITQWRSGFLPPVIVVGGLSALVLSEPDFGNAIVLCLVLFGMLYLAGARSRHLLGMLVPLGPLFMGLIWLSPERWERVMCFWNPWEHSQDCGYQLVQSFLAFGHGGVFGVGLAQGKQKLLYLPEGHTDFVLALVGEELGLIGTTTLILLFAILILRGFRVAAQAPDSFGRYLTLGVTLLLGVQALINAGVVSGLLPTKGLTLPLVSYGGSSLLTSLLAIGMVLSVSRKREV